MIFLRAGTSSIRLYAAFPVVLEPKKQLEGFYTCYRLLFNLSNPEQA